MKQTLLAFIITVICNSFCFGQVSTKDRLLDNSAIVYDSSGEFSEEFKDRLKEDLANVRIVALGEASHEDGSTFEQKVNLVKLLHQEMGYEVIAFEYGFYGNWKTNENIKAGMDVEEATKYSGWSKSAYAFPIYQYIAESYETEYPLHYAGFDKEKVPDGIPNINALINTMISHLEIDVNPPDRQVLDSLVLAIYSGMGNEFKNKITYYQRNRAKEIIKKLQSKLLDNRNQLMERFSETEITVWDYTLQSILMSEKTVFAGSFHNIVRDKNMADRIIFLADSIYSGKKIILWGASGHFARNMISIDRNLPENSYGFFPYYQTGDWLYEHFGSQYYSIAFTSGEGKVGTIYPEGHRFKKYEELRTLKNDHSNSYEFFAKETGVDFLFTSLKLAEDEAGATPNMSIVTYALGYQEDYACWNNVFDSFFFIKNMKPDKWR